MPFVEGEAGMADERISTTPSAPRCPFCEGRIASTPQGPCPACGRKTDAASSLPVPSVRLDEPNLLADDLWWSAAALASLLAAAAAWFSVENPLWAPAALAALAAV